MIIDQRAKPVLDQFLAANEREGEAVRHLLAALQAGERDKVRLTELTKRMEDAHNEKMRLHGELQAYRLDK